MLTQAIAKCVSWKARAVEKDERDVLGLREVLNFGHTLGHALETATNYEHYRHGEAVILGMRVAARLSVIKGHLKRRIKRRLRRVSVKFRYRVYLMVLK